MAYFEMLLFRKYLKGVLPQGFQGMSVSSQDVNKPLNCMVSMVAEQLPYLIYETLSETTTSSIKDYW